MSTRDETSPHAETPDRGLEVRPGLWIPWRELEVRATKSGGPGGQHVNTSSTRIELVWNVRTSSVLDDAARGLLLTAIASRLDSAGCLRIVASDTRSQKQNRELAEARLAALVARGLVVPRRRKKTKPTRGSVERRLSTKRRHADKKSNRRRENDD